MSAWQIFGIILDIVGPVSFLYIGYRLGKRRAYIENHGMFLAMDEIIKTQQAALHDRIMDLLKQERPE